MFKGERDRGGEAFKGRLGGRLGESDVVKEIEPCEKIVGREKRKPRWV